MSSEDSFGSCQLDCDEGYGTYIKPPNPDAPENQIWSQPVAYCKKGAGLPSETEEAEEETPEDVLITLHKFGYDDNKAYSDIYSAQGYFWYNKKKGEDEEGNPKIERKKSLEHYNVSTIAKYQYQNGYNDKIVTATYRFTEYPDAKPTELMVRLNKGRNKYRSYFVGAPDEVNIYCQDISDAYDDRNICVSGNIRQLNRIDAKKNGWKVTGSFKMMKKTDGVPSEDIWLTVNGEKKRLTYLSEKAEDPNNNYIKRDIPREDLKRLDDDEYLRVYLEGEGDVCSVRNIIGPKIYANCPEKNEDDE